MKLNLYRYKRSWLITLLVLLFNTSYSQKLNWIPFNWEGDTIEGRYFEKFAMSVPITIDNLPYHFKMQLDLGAENTIIYGSAINSYLYQNNGLSKKIDTTLYFYFSNKKYPMFKNIDLKLGKVSAGKINIGYLKGYGNEIPTDSITTKSEKFIGTLAPDVFQGKVLIIDYPNNRLCIVDKVPAIYAAASFQPFKIKNGRIRIPLNINGQQVDLLFDTGSSMFNLLTTETRAKQISELEIVDSVKTSTWGDHYYVYGRRTNVNIEFGNSLLKPTTVFADRKHKFDNFYQQENIWGITGNGYFLSNVVIIDYNNRLIGIK